jgi:hypothetical protein
MKFARFKFWDGQKWVKSYSIENKTEADDMNRRIGRIFYVPIDTSEV